MDPVSARVQELVDHSGLSQKEFAQRIELNPAIISHILSGRNKPSLSVIQAITNVFTNVNLNYLLRGEGALFMENTPSPAQADSSASPAGTFDFQQMEGVRQVAPPGGAPLPQPSPGEKQTAASSPAQERPENAAAKQQTEEEKQSHYKSESRAFPPPQRKKEIERVIIFYTDHSLEEYRP
jgi:transcriptional regulator with XRE-family HTH domain